MSRSSSTTALAAFAALALASLAAAESKPTERPGEREWPSFRGPFAEGVRDGQQLPDRWDGTTGEGVVWRAAVPGLGHSSPVIWGDRLLVTTAVSSRGGDTFRHGLYGDGDASDDRSPQRFMVLAFDKRTGKSLWQTTVREAVPLEKRHIKATYANQTPAIDGEVVVAFFGSSGLFALDLDGRVLWHHEFGHLDVGAYDAPDYEWGSASSPILYRDLVIVQCDTQGDDYLLALDKRSGEVRWRTARDELPSWGTPTVVYGPARVELVTNASNFVRGYDPDNGTELWRLAGSSKITAPTPIAFGDWIVVASGRAPERPIFVIRKGATGDITPPAGESSSAGVVWSVTGRGPYMPTPLVYGDLLYIVANQGILDAYEVASGREVYRQRLPHRGGGFSGSPVAADGKLYLPAEDGDVFVVRAGRDYELIATNPLGERLMSTPAISEGRLFLRSEHSLLAIGAKRPE